MSLAACLVLSLMIGATLSVEQNGSFSKKYLYHWQKQQKQNAKKGQVLKVTVSPKLINFYPGKTATVKCRVKGVYNVTQSPDVGFYMMFDKNTVMPLSSGVPGVSIQSSPVANFRNMRYRRTVLRLTLHKEIFHLLRYGENKFYCKGNLVASSLPSSANLDSLGNRFVDYFVVRKSRRK